MATIGKNQFFEIKNGDGTSFHNLVLRKSAVESIVMSLGDKISGDVYYKDNSLSVTMHEYITYNGVNYMLINPPTIVREGIVSDNSELKGMTKYSFVFYHPMCQLANFPFSDVAVTSDETRYLSEGKTFSWIGKPADFVAKLNKNLTGTEWIVELSSRFPQDKLDELSDVIPFDNATIADACKTFYDVWGVPYVVDKVASTEASYAAGKRFKLVMGLPSNEIYENATAEQQNTPFVFQMGHGVGLKNNSRTPRNNKIVTRISGYGSENNIPYGYPQVRWYGTAGQAFTYGDHAGVYTDVTIDGVHLDKVVSYPIYKGILNGEYVELIKHPFTRAHLMPSVYRTCLFNKISFLDDNGEFNTDYDPDITLIDYYDAVYSSQYPYPNTINLQAPSYESHEFVDEKPELGEAHIISATPLNNDLTPASSWDDSLDDEGNYNQSYFQLVLPRLSFDLYACASITEEMQINMRSGACLGCTFAVQIDWDDYKRNFYDEDGNFAPNGSQRDLTKYPKSNKGSISLVLQKDNSTFGTLMPNMYQYPNGETSVGAGDGDMFVILGISLPESYIFAAEWRLDADMKSYMLENNVHYFDYPLKFDEDFLFHNENILSQIRPNTIVRFNYADQTQALFVKQITIKYGEQALPQYDITLTDNVEVVLNQIGQVAEDVEKLSTLIAILRQSYGKNVWNELAKKLSKTQDDTAAGFITMLKGLQVGNQFVSGLLGEGGVLRVDADGKTYLEADKMYIRMRAYFDTVEVREYKHSAGNRVASPAGAKCVRVAWFNSSNEELEQTQENLSSVAYFRCYFRADDGEDTVRNNFVVGDQVYCHITTVNGADDNPSTKGLNQKHYWRLCIGKNTDNNLTEKGEGWIDLSNRSTESIGVNSYTGYQINSDVPEPQDSMVQLGNVNDTTRQGAIIEFVTGADAPSYQIYQGIDSFSLTGRNMITLGYNSATGKAELNVYGDAFIGDPNRTTYIEYVQDDGTDAHAPVLNIKAKIQTLPNSTYEGKTASQFVRDNQLKYDTDIQNLTNITNNLQSQIDGEIVSWFYEGTPTLDNAPAVDWNTDTLKERHLGDMYYDVGTGATSGFAYRFIKSEQGVYSWQYIDDTAITLALAKAAEALGLAGSKAKTYTTANNVLPSAPYNVGDLWLNATGTWGSGANTVTWENEILKCINACPANGTPNISDWAKASKYTDDSAFNGYINAFLNGSSQTGDSYTAAAIQKAIASALGSGIVVDGGLLLTSLIGMRKNIGTTENPVYETWAGISGQYDANVKGGGIAAWYGGAMVDKEDVQTLPASYAKSLFRFDGSGYLAGGNITWDANGIVTIANVYANIGGQDQSLTGTLQTLTNLSNALPLKIESGTTYLDPKYGFTNLSIKGKEVATKEWANGQFVTKTWFDNIFRLYNGTTKVNVNDTIPLSNNLNIEAMFGFWTKKYISALGQGDDGSSSYSTLAALNDVIITSPAVDQVLAYNGTHWYNKTINLGSLTLAGLSDVTISSPAANQMLGYDATTHKWVNVAVPAKYTLPTATDSVLGGVKVGTTLAIANGVLNLHTTGVTAGTYKRVTVDAYGRVTSGDNTDTDTNTWRNIYVGGTSKVGTGIDTKAINFKAGSNVAISYVAAGTGSGQSGNANYFDVVISATDTTYSAATQSAAGLMSAADKKKLDGIAEGANKYSLPLAASGTRGGVQIGFTTDAANRNYAVQLSSEKMYVNVPWENTWRGIQNNLTSQSTTDSLSAYQGYLLANGSARDNTKLPLTGGTLTGTLTARDVVVQSAYTLKIGDAILKWDSDNNALKLYKLSGSSEVAVNFYATGGVSALGMSEDGSAGAGDVTWALLRSNDDERPIAWSHISAAVTAQGYATQSWVTSNFNKYVLPTATTSALGGIKVGYTTSGTNYKVQLDTNGNAYVTVPWNNDNTTYKLKLNNSWKGDTTNGVNLGEFYAPTTAGSGFLKGTAGSNGAITWSWDNSTYLTQHQSLAAYTKTADYKTLTFKVGTDSIGSYSPTSALGLLFAAGNNISLSVDSSTHKLTIANTYSYTHPTNGANTTITAANGKVLSAITVNNLGHVTSVSAKTLAAADIPDLGGTYLKLSGGTMSNTNIVTNLNADYLDGYHESSFLRYRVVTHVNGEATLWSQLGLKQYNGALPESLSGAYNYGQVVSFATLDARFEIYASHQSSNPSDGTNGLYYRTGWDSDKRQWTRFLDSNNSSVSKSGKTLTVKINGTTQSLTNTNTTYSASTGLTLSGTAFSINSTYQTYISHGESAYNSLSNYLPLAGGTMTGTLTSRNIAPSASNTYHIGASGSEYAEADIRIINARHLNYARSYVADKKVYIQYPDDAGDTIINPTSGNVLMCSDVYVGTTAIGFNRNTNNGNVLVSGKGGAQIGYTSAGRLDIGTMTASGSYSTRMSILQSNGNIGIGTITPSATLDVIGSTRVTGLLTALGNITTDTANGSFIQVGSIRLVYDSTNNAIKIVKSDGTQANLYATGGVSALGAGQESGGGSGDVTWALLASQATGGRTIHSSYISSTLSNYATVSSLGGYMKVTPTNAARNANTIYDAGLYELSEGSNLPFGAQYGVILSLPYRQPYGNSSTDFSTQIALPNGDDSSYPNSMCYRTSLKSGWNAWQRVQNVSMSDVRLKTILSNPTFGIEQIANAPIIRYKWSKDGYGDKNVHIGSTAQYWMNVANEFVEQEYNGYYSLQYGVAALISAITIARKVMTHEEKIALLETRVSALEKENGEQEQLINSLQEELANFKAA